MRVTLQPHYTAEILNDCFFADYIGEPIASKRQAIELIHTDIPKILMNLPSSVWFGKITISKKGDEGRGICVEWERPRIVESITEINSAKLLIPGKQGSQREEDITEELIAEVTRRVAM